MVAAALFREVFADIEADDRPDLSTLAAQHARTALHGLLMEES
jgi:hypothetical protein